MTEAPTTPAEPMPPVEPAPSPSRRRLIIGIAVGLVVAVVAVVGGLFAFNALTAKAVVLYTSEAEGYSVMAPGEPTHEDALAGALPTTIAHWTDGERYFSVSSTDGADVPPSQRGLVLHELLIGALKEAPEVTESDLESSAVADAFLEEPDQIAVAGGDAVEFATTLDGAAAPFRVVFTAHANKIYMLVFSDSDESEDEDFLESFTFLTADASSERPEKEVYTSEEEGYSVEMFGEPEVVESSSLFGEEYAKVQSIWDFGSEGYFIQTFQFPEDFDKPLDVALTDSVAGMVANTPGATLIEDERVDFNGETAAVGVVDAPSGLVRFVVVAHNYRQYLLVAPLKDDNSDEDFIASFRFLN